MDLVADMKKIMKDNQLSIKETAYLCGLSIDTIKAYLSNPQNKRYRVLPESTIFLLKKTIQRRKEIIPEMHRQFEAISTNLGNLSILESGILKKIQKQLQGQLDEFWSNFIELDLDRNLYSFNIKQNEEFQTISELQRKNSLNDIEKS